MQLDAGQGIGDASRWTVHCENQSESGKHFFSAMKVNWNGRR
jgi:hypothetical protein